MNEEHEKHLDRLKTQTCLRMAKKYRAGQKEHGGYLPNKGVIKLLDSALEEAIDQVVYLSTLKELLTGIEHER